MVPALLVLASATAASPIVTAVSCDLAIAGAGPGGIYSAWRYLAGHSTGNVCVFERSERHGGRIYSLKNQGPRNDLTVDVGAYRYAPEPEKEGSWYIYTPLLAGLIDTRLGLPSATYEPGSNSTLRKIVDAEGENAGYATFVDAMLSEIRAEPKYASRFALRYHEELVSVTPASSSEGVTLSFASGLSAVAGDVILNLPQLPLLKVLERSEALLGGSSADVPPALLAPLPTDGVKLYVHYTKCSVAPRAKRLARLSPSPLPLVASLS